MTSNEKRLSNKIKALQFRIVGAEFEKGMDAFEKIVAQRVYAADDPEEFIRHLVSGADPRIERSFMNQLIAAGCTLAERLEIDLDN